MSSFTPARDPVSEPLTALIDVFGAHAATLCFPEVDHPTLDGLAAGLREAAAEVERCERALGQARQVLDERREALRGRAERGLAYARIYAEDDETLREQLEGIDLGASLPPAARRSAKRAPSRRSRRTTPAVADETVKELPFSPGHVAHAGAA